MTNREFKINAKAFGMTTQEYAALRYAARKNLDKRLARHSK